MFPISNTPVCPFSLADGDIIFYIQINSTNLPFTFAAFMTLKVWNYL